MALLKKTDILEGINKAEKYEIKSLNGELYLRPLSQAEWNSIDEIEAKAIGTFETHEKARRGKRQTPSQIESKGTIQVAKTTLANQEARTKAVYLSLNNSQNEEWSEDEANQLSRKAFNEIYEKVQEISGITENIEDEVEDFPSDK